MSLRRWWTNPIVIAALVEFVILAIVVILILTRTQGAPHV
jgi:hypothetical protein